MTKPRLLQPEDAEAWRALRLHGLAHSPQAFGASLAEEQDKPLAWFAERLRNSGVFGAADAEGRLLGTVALGLFNHAEKLRHKGFVWGMYVRPEARGAGLGRALMQALIGHATGQVEELRLDVVVGNAPALALYQRLGFIAYGTEPRALKLAAGTYLDEVLMALRLPPAAAAAHG
jgi:ribosomal protein S18 acetylase RimI-like enzyme